MKFMFTGFNRAFVAEYTDPKNARVLLPYDHGVSKKDADAIAALEVGGSYSDCDGDHWRRVE